MPDRCMTRAPPRKAVPDAIRRAHLADLDAWVREIDLMSSQSESVYVHEC